MPTVWVKSLSGARFISIYFHLFSMGQAGKRGCFGRESKRKGKINRKKSEEK
jgi:hypothetical protein